MSQQGERVDVAVVGAGVTGLALSHRLRARGVEHRVLEAEASPGGVVRSVETGGRVLELGPQRTRRVPAVDRLVAELGLEGEVLEGRADLPLYVYRAGRLRRVPFSLDEFLRTDLLTWRGKLRVLAEPLTRGARPDESVAAYVTRKFGREAYEYLVGPLYGGIYGSDPARMPVKHSLGRDLDRAGVAGSLLVAGLRWMLAGTEAPAPLSFRGGMQTLTDALYREGEERIALEEPALELGSADGRWVVVTPERRLAVRHVVLTCPADESAGLLEAEAPGAASRLHRLRYNSLALVHLESGTELEGYGYQVALGEALATRGVTFNDSLFGREDVYTAFLGGAGRDELIAAPDAELGQRAAEEFRQVTGSRAGVLRVSRAEMPAWDESWTALAGLELPAGLHLCANWEGRAGIPGRLESAEDLAGELATLLR